MMAMQNAGRATWRDYKELTKPNVVLLMILTAAIGMFMAVPGMVPLNALILGNLGIALCAGSAATINHLVDQRMSRTHRRPVAQGRVGPRQAALFAAVTGLLGMGILLLWVNALTAWLTFASLLGYAVVYTMFLKRATPQNIVIGGASGAMPPVLGWAAVTGEVSADALLLFLIIFAWTPPHFWALALYRTADYARAGLPMLPVTHGSKYTRLSVLLYTFILLAVTLLPFATRMSGLIYLFAALALGAVFLRYAWRLYVDYSDKLSQQTFRYSIIYLSSLFAALLVDHYLRF